MANTVYAKCKEGLAGKQMDWANDTIKASLVRGYTPNFSTHQFLSDVTGAGGTLVATTGALTSKTLTGGVLDAADPAVITGVAAGAAINHIVLYSDTGTPSTSRLWCADDTGTGLPLTPDGNNIQITWDNGANKILAL